MTKQQAEKKTVKFETEVSKLLDIVANSLYTEKEIFLRELISNSSDACEKLRYVSQTDSKAPKTNKFQIRIHLNEKNKTISIKDNGIGMDDKDMQSNLGTIAKSGTEEFIKKMGDKKGDINQIGKFGVGFYSSFMVSDQVVVRSKKYDSSSGYLWTSDGKGTFSIEETEYNEIGTEITLSIKKDEKEFLSKYKIEEIIKKYSDFVPFPIFVTSEEDKNDKKKDDKTEEQVNSAEAIWLKDKSKIKKDDYKSFYNQVSNYYDEPLTTIHFKAEGVVNYTALLYLPKSQPQDLYHPDRKNKLKLYVNKVFISDKLDALIPAWLRFVPGVVDTEDLSLNISREILQNNAVINKISNANFSNEAFPWLSAQKIDLGLAPSIAMRMNFVGELGWELHHPIEYQNHIFDKLMEAGKDLGIKPFGIRAMNSLRLEKSYKLVGTELSIEYSPYESGLDRFIHPNKGNFIGLEALNKWREKGFDNKLVTLEVHNTTDSDVLGNNPIYKDDKVVGRATGGEYGFRLDKSIALAMVKPDLANVGEKLKVDILGKMYEATILEESPYDVENKLLRA